MKRLVIIILSFSFPLIPILSQEFTESKQTKYPHIKELLVAKLNDQAQREIDKLIIDAPNDPTLNYYQTEVWFNKGEQEYKASNFKKALEYYEKADQFWSGNPLLSERIKDTKEKIKNPPSAAERGEAIRLTDALSQGQSNVNIIILDKETQDEFRTQLKGVLKENYSQTQTTDSITISKPYLVLFAGLGFCLVVANVVSLTILLRGKNEIK